MLHEEIKRDPIERPLIPPVRFTHCELSDEDCRTDFSFSVIITRARTRAHVEEAMCVLLERLPFPCRWRMLTRRYKRSESGMSNMFNYLLALISRRIAPSLAMGLGRVGQRVGAYSDAVMAKGALVSNVWGFVDGTVRGVCRPGDGTAQRSIYKGHMRKHAAKFQAVVLPDGIIGHLYGPARGNTHEIRTLRQYKLEERIS
ncbi:TPA: hypothetical protein N0F65_009474 [Lagenidium giganteum]|uniref:DDE Tnp4 domain-containing protein n=1 Tax=Lagenidium giganteum TaxID=4803 RepID=A0AAV2ZE53_9STRA|nr:TPA: hypothetical protein N0F65_009474 [Lagenidium giganteum]